MGPYRNVSVNFWTDPKVDDYFSPEEKYFYLYLLTNPHTNICGCYEIGKNQMARETGYDWSDIRDIIDRLQNVHHVIEYDHDTKEVLLVNWSKYNWSRSPKVEAAVIAAASYIKSSEFRQFVFDCIENRKQKQKAEAEGRNRKQNQKAEAEAETDTDTVTVTVTGRYGIDTVSENERLCPPLDDILSYCDEIGYSREKGMKFFSRYEGQMMTDWKHALRKWKDSEYGSKRENHNIRHPEFSPGKEEIEIVRRMHGIE